MLMCIEKVEELRDQARDFDKEGDARYQKGNLEGAKACYLEAFRLRFRLYWKGGTPDARVDMCISYVKMNRIYEESGEPDRADRLLCNAANLLIKSENGKAVKHEGPISIIEVNGIAPRDLKKYTYKLSYEVETPIVIIIDDNSQGADDQYFYGLAMGRDDIELEKILNTSYTTQPVKADDFYLFILSKDKKEEFKKEVLVNARAIND